MVTQTMIEIPSDGGDFQLVTLPFIGKLPRQCSSRVETVEQFAIYHDIRSHFANIGLALKAYFSGAPKPKFADQLLIEKELDYYLSLYNLIWFGWEQIEVGLVDRDIPLGSELAPDCLPDTPGGMLRFILLEDCLAMMEPYLEPRVIKANKVTGVSLKESAKILRGNTGKEPLEGFSSKTIERQAGYTSLYAKDSMSRAVTGQLIAFIEYSIKKRCRGNNTLRRKLKQFQAVRQQKIKTISKLANALLQKSSKTI